MSSVFLIYVWLIALFITNEKHATAPVLCPILEVARIWFMCPHDAHCNLFMELAVRARIYFVQLPLPLTSHAIRAFIPLVFVLILWICGIWQFRFFWFIDLVYYLIIIFWHLGSSIKNRPQKKYKELELSCLIIWLEFETYLRNCIYCRYSIFFYDTIKITNTASILLPS